VSECATSARDPVVSGPRREPGPVRTLLVALAVCTVCSLVVATTSVLLAPRQRANREHERQRAVHALIERQPGLSEVLSENGAGDIRQWVVELATGQIATWIDPLHFDARREARDPLASTAIPADRDLAGIGRRADHATAYVVVDDDRAVLIILPVHGQGYGGTMRGYVALAGDTNTVVGLSFHEHSETPGVGAVLLDDHEWLAEWRGKRVRDVEERVRIGVAAQELDPDSDAARYEVDAVTGATRTCGGVTNLLRYWLGDDGFGRFLGRLREGGAIR